jgi:manganese/zinc/iron transport system permease protein
MWLAILNLGLVLGFILLVYKELNLTSFDESFSMAIGIPAGMINLSLMSMVSYTTVSSFEEVGAILVVALLVVPPATAYLWTKKLIPLIQLTCLIGLVISLLGYYFAYFFDSSIAGMIVTVSGILFLGSAFLKSKKHKFKLGTSKI